MSFLLEFVRGDDRTVTVTLKDDAGAAYVWTGSKLWFTAKLDVGDLDANAIISKSSPSSGITFPAAGTATVVISHADTINLPNHRTVLFCDVQLKDASGSIHTVDSGVAVVEPEVTGATT